MMFNESFSIYSEMFENYHTRIYRTAYSVTKDPFLSQPYESYYYDFRCTI